MNVRVYMEKAMEGLGSFAAAIAMPHAFRANALSTLIVGEHHVRYIREIHPGRPIRMTGCVLSWDETSALIYQDMRHGDGTPAAAFRTRVFHVDVKTGKPFPWSTRSRAQLEALIEKAPEDTKPRGLDIDKAPLPKRDANLSRALNTGAPEIGRGTVPPQHCDVFGRMQAEWFMGRISDAVPNLLYNWRRDVASKAEGAKMGAAVLEYRLVYRKWPRAGDRFVVHSALAAVAEKTHTLSHWMLDPDTGEAWMTSEAVAVTFDLNTRKVIPTPPEQMTALEQIAPRGLTL